MAPSAFFSFCILWSSCLAIVAAEEPTDDIRAQRPALPLTNASSTSKSNIFIVFILVQFALLLQPRGSLVYIARQTWLWRINPVLCLYETALVVYYLLFPQSNSLSISIIGFKQTAMALLFVRGLPLATDVRTGEEIHSSRITDITHHRQIADTIEIVTWSRFLNPHDSWQPLGEAYPIPVDDNPFGMHSTDKRKQVIGVVAILVAIFRIRSIQDAPFITTLLSLYVINWSSIQTLMLLGYPMYSNGASSDLEDAAKGPKYENEQISNQAKRILYHARTFRKKRAIDHLVHLVWLWIVIQYICDLISADRGVLFEISGSKLYSGDPSTETLVHHIESIETLLNPLSDKSLRVVLPTTQS
ncbi:hypothetical protein H072_10924 [Dactylellina haptotyla CBS 200.50]|uniref:Uncharacterized protein n=1 Tax=Dactylellina haptotyla (strain CBS 200.50) TaxID=1284197 RepID=S8BK77_DACHA|nr:hypothetical protein H072_10924 [Dactylellina haptotyla CBS 200.50]